MALHIDIFFSMPMMYTFIIHVVQKQSLAVDEIQYENKFGSNARCMIELNFFDEQQS